MPVPFERRVRSVVSGRVLLIGDAAGYLDPITGEGIRLGLDTARSAVSAICADSPPRPHQAVQTGHMALLDTDLRLTVCATSCMAETPHGSHPSAVAALFSRILEMLNNA